jgi:nucleoside-diphosphate-sugar epimerase
MNGDFLTEVDSEDRQRILIIGGTGHVGAALGLHLAGRGHQVTVTGRRPVLLSDPRIRTVLLDLAQLDLDKEIGPQDTVILSPWVASGATSNNWMAELINQMSDFQIRSVIYFSSMWVYGKPLRGNISELMEAQPADAYGSAHRANEQVLAAEGDRLGLDITLLRMSNLVGADPLYPKRTKVSFTHEMAAMAIQDCRIVLRSAPSTPRNLLARSRLHHDIDAILQRVESPGRIEILNAGGDQTTTVGAFARRIAKVATEYHGYDIPIEHPEDQEDKVDFVLESEKVRSLAGPCPNDLDREISMVFDDVLSTVVGEK